MLQFWQRPQHVVPAYSVGRCCASKCSSLTDLVRQFTCNCGFMHSSKSKNAYHASGRCLLPASADISSYCQLVHHDCYKGVRTKAKLGRGLDDAAAFTRSCFAASAVAAWGSSSTVLLHCSEVEPGPSENWDCTKLQPNTVMTPML